jgi:predicted transcriptional regulator of viral defense system
MSGEATLWAARQDITNHAAKLALMAICDASDKSGRCRPSIEALRDFVRADEAVIREAIAWLEDEGWIKTIGNWEYLIIQGTARQPGAAL